MSKYQKEIVDKHLTDMLKTGVIEKSESKFCSPIVLVKKVLMNGDFALITEC
ncbi:hypothetical protein COBT_001286 [Conglomerata obtusa]